jgi:hypothetical protein
MRVSSLDIFRKVDQNYQEKSASGGIISILVYVLLVLLVWSETRDWWHTKQRYTFLVDKVGIEGSLVSESYHGSQCGYRLVSLGHFPRRHGQPRHNSADKVLIHYCGCCRCGEQGVLWAFEAELRVQLCPFSVSARKM